MRTEPCKSCGTTIIWATTEHGNWMPVEAAPLPAPAGGNVVLEEPADPREPPLARVLCKGALTDKPRHVAHFVNCRDAQRWRRSR